MSVVGTVPYLAPEVIRDRKCSKAMDVWSFGLVLWEVLTGATPFEDWNFREAKIPSSCPPDLRLIIESCWRDDPLERPTFKELIGELERFGNKFRTTDPHDQTVVLGKQFEHSTEKYDGRNIINCKEMARKAEELQKREEKFHRFLQLKKGERELKLKTMIFELQQTLSERPPKEKPQPPKRRQHLKCEDISKPYDLKTEISLTKNMQMIECKCLLLSNAVLYLTLQNSGTSLIVFCCEILLHDVENCVWYREFVFLALNRGAGIALNGALLNGSTDQICYTSTNSEKFTLKNENFDRAECCPVQQRVPSKSTPDLLKLYRLPVHNASPKLKRVNACKVKRDSARTSAEEEVDERCVEVINDKATPRRVIQLPPPTKKLAADHHVRSSSTVVEHARSKLNKEEDRGFFRNIFKRDTKDRNCRVTGTLPKSMITRSPLGPSTMGSSTILKNMTPSKHTRIKSPTKPSPSKAGKKKKYSANAQNDKYDLTENSKTFMKCNERRISATSSQASAVYPVSSSPVSIYCSTDELYSGKRTPYEKLSEASDPSVMENPLYILPRNFPSRDRASTSASRIFFNGSSLHGSKSPPNHTSCDDRLNNSGLSTIENLSYKPPNEIKTSRTTMTQITLDSPVEGGIDMDATKRSINSLNSENASCCEDSSLSLDRSLHETALNVSNIYVPMLTVEQNMSSSHLSDQCNGQKESLIPDDRIHYINESAQVGCEHPPEMQAPSLPGAALGYRPQRPYTLDLTSPPTPAESGISTAGSSYHSFSSTDQGLQDHAPSHPVDSVPRLAPPIPPRNNTRRPEDEAVALQRQRLSPVSQSP
ncbi:Mitogen-activated protein kinase kinase kinase [Dirofilaria immitis]|nr:Mitogen-activated protein kinase kinase kinase [Dirofilaria immitis]